MVIERAQMSIKPGEEAAFDHAMVKGRALLAAARGCHSVTLLRGIENPSTYMLLLEWETVDDHVDFTSTPEFARFREMAGPFFAEAPQMEHFAVVGATDRSPVEA